MTPDAVLSLGREAGTIALLIAGPLLGAGLVVGVAVSVFQAVTHKVTGGIETLTALMIHNDERLLVRPVGHDFAHNVLRQQNGPRNVHCFKFFAGPHID